jgi:hypothetical protein
MQQLCSYRWQSRRSRRRRCFGVVRVPPRKERRGFESNANVEALSGRIQLRLIIFMSNCMMGCQRCGGLSVGATGLCSIS